MKTLTILFSLLLCASVWSQQSNVQTVGLPPARDHQEGKSHKEHEAMYLAAIDELALYQQTNRLALSTLMSAQDGLNAALASTNILSDTDLKSIQDSVVSNQAAMFKVERIIRTGDHRLFVYRHQLDWARLHLKLDDFRAKTGLTEWTDSRTTVGTTNAISIHP